MHFDRCVHRNRRLFFVAPFLALVYKFPILFSGMESGPSAMLGSVSAVAFYGIMGGFVILGVLGAAAGAIASKVVGANRHRAWKIAVVLGLTANFASGCASM